MYPVSGAYIAAIRRPSRQKRIQGLISLVNGNSVAFSDENLMSGSFAYDTQCVNGEELNFGSVYAAQISFAINNPEVDRYALYGAIVTVAEGVYTENGWEDIPLGEFVITEATRIAEVVSIKALDKMIELDAVCETATSGTVSELLGFVSVATGVELSQTAEELGLLVNGTMQFGMSVDGSSQTYRDLVADIAEVCACFAIMDRQGRLKLVPFSTEITAAIPADCRYSSGFSDFEAYYTSLTAVCGDDEVSLQADTDTGLHFSISDNRLLVNGLLETKQEIVQNIFNALVQLRYTPSEVSIAGDVSLDLGDRLKYADAVESIVTSIAYPYRGEQKLESVGKNPRLAKAASKTERMVNAAMQNVEGLVVMAYTNGAEIDIGLYEQELANLYFGVSSESRLPFLSVTMILEVLQAGTISFPLRFNGNLLAFKPVQSFLAGRHTFTFSLPLSNVLAGVRNDIKVDVMTEDCRARISPFDVKVALMGSGISSGDGGGWNGFIELSEEFATSSLGRIGHYSFQDLQEHSMILPLDGGSVDSISLLTLRGLQTFIVQDAVSVMSVFTLSYSGNENSSGTVPETQTGTTAYIVAANVNGLAKMGYVFDGWNTRSDGLGVTYQPGDSITLNSDITLYAKWKVE